MQKVVSCWGGIVASTLVLTVFLGAATDALPVATKPTNLALHKPATASSMENDEHDPAKANDGDCGSFWCADDDSDGVPEFWQVDLKKAADLSGCRILWQFDGKQYRYRVEGSADGKTWSIISDQTKNTRLTQQHELRFANAKRVRYARILVTEAEEGCGVGICEVELFGESRTARDTTINRNHKS